MIPGSFFGLFLWWLTARLVSPTLQDSTYPEAERDGAVPVVDVEMIAPKRWQAYRNGLNALKRELSFVVDKGMSLISFR
ncbi:signal peptide-containing protein [Babesia caballi]|uniref:Signal peptide-containing protein n=1 Tax=Babesia caballi TaxID=5871 RepID=A0AAV4LZZ9_BABCB|nr:signal peptide-containing protein [Babesia caballi]